MELRHWLSPGTTDDDTDSLSEPPSTPTEPEHEHGQTRPHNQEHKQERDRHQPDDRVLNPETRRALGRDLRATGRLWAVILAFVPFVYVTVALWMVALPVQVFALLLVADAVAGIVMSMYVAFRFDVLRSQAASSSSSLSASAASSPVAATSQSDMTPAENAGEDTDSITDPTTTDHPEPPDPEVMENDIPTDSQPPDERENRIPNEMEP